MGPINFIKRVLGLKSYPVYDWLGVFDEIFHEIFKPYATEKSRFKWSRASWKLKVRASLSARQDRFRIHATGTIVGSKQEHVMSYTCFAKLVLSIHLVTPCEMVSPNLSNRR